MGRVAVRLLLLVALVSLPGAARPAAAADGPEPRGKPPRCECRSGKACWHYLRCPFRVPEDPCRCGMCAGDGTCAAMPRPEGWSAACMDADSPACFWRRHAASWGIRCRTCAHDTECHACDDLPRSPDAAAIAALDRQFDLEFADAAARKRACVGWSRHFYVATDIPQLKVLSQSGGPRVYEAHEIVHLFLQRAEQAFDDFVAVWGDEIRLDKPMAIYLATTGARKDAWRAAYFGAGKTQMVYAGAEGKIAGGFCWNGFAASLDDYDKDRDLHGYVRHMVGHILFSCWHGVGGFNIECPRWAFTAAGDWLCRSHPLLSEWTTFCQEEGNPATGNGKDWERKAREIAAGKRTPPEALFAVASLSRLAYEDIIRSWSYMDTMLREDRARWLNVMRRLRERKEHSLAFREGLGTTPEDFDARWADRLLGRRKTMADVPKDAAGAADPAEQERRRIAREQDPGTLGSLLRGLDRVRDAETARLVLDRLSLDADAVRETVAMLLARTQAPEIVALIRSEGLAHRLPLARAVAARALGALRDRAARPALEAMLSDASWYARACAAQALSLLADPASGPVLAAAVEDRDPRAFIAVADALASFGPAGRPATRAVAARLSAPEWQVRLAAARALAVFGDESAVEPLIDRLEAESGRLEREILRALRATTGETFGLNAATWRAWWKTERARGLPPRPPPGAQKPLDDPSYARPRRRDDPLEEDPTYYGRRIYSRSVVFVLDLSRSMQTEIEVAKDAQEKLGTLPKGPRIEIAKAAAKSAIARLDPRTRFNVVFFSSTVRPWKDALVPAGTHGEAAVGAVGAAGLEEETNIHGALRAAFGLHGRPTLDADLSAAPDTVFFLTDGTPTRGEITDTETILSFARDANRFRKIELNVIAMGSLGLDLPFLRRLAEENGGHFVHVPDRK